MNSVILAIIATVLLQILYLPTARSSISSWPQDLPKKEVKRNVQNKNDEKQANSAVDNGGLSLEFIYQIHDSKTRKKTDALLVTPPVMDLDLLKTDSQKSSSTILQRSTRDIPEEEQSYQIARSSDIIKQCDKNKIQCKNSGFCDSFFPRTTNSFSDNDISLDRNYQVTCMCAIGYAGVKCETEGNFRFPEFGGNGYLIFGLDPFDQISLTISIEIRPKLKNGIVLYAYGKYPYDQQFMALVLRDSKLQFRYNNGDGKSIISFNEPLALNEWHRVSVHRSKTVVWLQVNGTRNTPINIPVQQPLANNNRVPDRGSPFHLHTRLYVAGFPRSHSSGQISSQTDSDAGFVGCVSNITLNNMALDPRRKPFHGDALSGMNVFDCASGTCNHHKCKNQGKCKVIMPPHDYLCQCHNATGMYCEIPITRDITMPYFNGRAFLKLKKGLKKTSKSNTEIEIVFRAEEPEGLLLYSGYSRDTRGDFVAIGLKQQRVHVAFDLGSGPAIIESKHKIELHRWTTIKFFRSGRQGTLQVSDQGEKVEGYSPGHLVQLTIKLDTFLGGHKNYDEVSEYMKIHQNFVGCVQKVSFGELGSVLFPEDTKLGVNVVQCTNHSCADHRDLCGPGGECVPLGPSYQCQCKLGFAGLKCDQVRSRRDVNSPQFSKNSYLVFKENGLLRRRP